MNEVSLQLRLFSTNSGQLYIAEESKYFNGEIITGNLFSYKISKNFECSQLFEEKQKLINCEGIRKYKQIVFIQKEEYYVFQYEQGETIDRKIFTNYRLKNYSIPQIQLNSYLSQLLEILYTLHSQNYLGRVFSTQNIILKEGQKVESLKNNQIILMDFGFGPELYQPDQNIDLILPPDIVQQILSNNCSKNNIDQLENQEKALKYDISLDSWLLGAFLYQLGQLVPINAKADKQSRKYYYFKQNLNDLQEYLVHLSQHNQNNFLFQNNKYGQEFRNLVEQLLIFDPKKRLSFFNLYQSKYIQNLNVPNIQQKINFYRNLEKAQNPQVNLIQQNIEKREAIIDLILFEEEITLPQIIQDNQRQAEQEEISPTSIIQDDPWPPKDLKIFIPQNYDIENSKMQNIWLLIQMEAFRYYILNQTATLVDAQFSTDQYPQKLNLVHSLKKMSFLVLIEFLNLLLLPYSSLEYISDQDWQKFKATDQVQLLIIQIIKEKEKHHDLVGIQQEEIQNLQSNNFLKEGFRQNTSPFYHFLQKEILEQPTKSQFLQDILLKITFCHLINRIFNLENINNQFMHIKPTYQSLIGPREIYEFIQRQDNTQQKQEEIKFQIDKNFSCF